MSIVGLLFTTVAVFCVFSLVCQYHNDLFYRYAGIIALIGHLLVAIAIIPLVPYEWDIPTFHAAATRLMLGRSLTTSPSVGSFAAFQALIYAIAGRDPTILAFVNGLLAVLIPIPACYLARQLYSSIESTHGLTVLLLFSPLPFLFTTIPMRDTLSILITFTVLSLVVRAIIERQPWLALVALPLWAMLYLLRPELALIIILGVVAAIIVRSINSIAYRELSLPSLLGMASFAGLLGFVLFTSRFSLSSVNASLQGRATGGAAYLAFVEYQSWLEILLAAPARAIYFQFAPFPLHVNSIFDFIAVLPLPLLIVLTVSAYRSLRNCETDTTVAILLLTVYLFGIIGYGLIDSNFGTTVRHRIPFVFLLGIFATPVLRRWVRLVRFRFSERPRQSSQQHEQQREAQKLHAGSHVRSKYLNNTHGNDDAE